jgi:hypothetical protein
MSELGSESGHWYHANGNPCYTLIGKNGKERNTHVGDARKLGLVPSVTTVIAQLNKPGLNNWIQDQLMLAALTLPRNKDEDEGAYANRVRLDSRQQSNKAGERGTSLHASVEKAIQCKQHEHMRHVEAIAYEMSRLGLPLRGGDAEKTFAHPDGFGGKIDWRWLVNLADFKSKDSIEQGKKLWWDEHLYQLAAYAYGLGIENPRCFNIFVGVDDAKVVIHEWPPEELERGLKIFKLLLEIFQLRNKL